MISTFMYDAKQGTSYGFVLYVDYYINQESVARYCKSLRTYSIVYPASLLVYLRTKQSIYKIVYLRTRYEGILDFNQQVGTP